MIDFVKVGSRIANLRKQSKLSQEELAERLFITRQALSKWENGTSIPSIDSLLEISKIFNTSFEYLLCLGEEGSLDIDPDDIFNGHERNFVIQNIIQGKIKVDIPNVIYQMSPTERLTILKGIKEKKIECNYEELVVKLTESEKKYLFGGAYYVVQKRK
ncbi:MAG: helix-turn-helix transcriptional regulator [Erysipelotrichaceae bacterium]|nr:helix-turn-helix transcriptional regulator [Erysipelotrichaceae bacterium]